MFICPNCGEPVRDDARACPHCGSDDETGWNPDADYLSVDIPDHGPETAPPRAGVSNAFAIFLVVIGVLGLIAFTGIRGAANPFSLIGVVAIIAGVVMYLRRKG